MCHYSSYKRSRKGGSLVEGGRELEGWKEGVIQREGGREGRGLMKVARSMKEIGEGAWGWEEGDEEVRRE